MTDGACLNNGQANPRAGWAFVQGLSLEGEPLVVSGRLEQQGPWGDDGLQTSNRAELRAVIAALRFRHWPGEGFRRIVIATDSEYIVDGSTQWARTWVRNNWRTTGRMGDGYASVKNKDLWEMLLGGCERAHDGGLAVHSGKSHASGIVSLMKVQRRVPQWKMRLVGGVKSSEWHSNDDVPILFMVDKLLLKLTIEEVDRPLISAEIKTLTPMDCF